MIITVRRFPDRKKPCLTLEDDNQGIILATFLNDKAAERFQEAIGIGNCITIEDDEEEE